MKRLFRNIKRFLTVILPQRSTSRTTVLVIIGDAILFSSIIVTSMILARIIPVDSMATYRQVIYLAPLVQAIVEFGLASSIYRFWNLLDPLRRSTFLKMVITISLGMGLLGSLGLAVFAKIISQTYNNPLLFYALLIICLYPLFNILPLSIRPVQICRGEPMLATGLQLIISVLNVLELIIPIMLGYPLLVALAVWNFTSVANLVIVPLVFKPNILPGTPWWDKQLFKEIWDYLWPMQAARIPGLLTYNTDSIATSIYLNKQDFAAYSLGAREIPFIGKIGSSVSSVLVPKLIEDVSQGNIDTGMARWRHACERTAVLTYPIASFCVLFSLPIVTFLFSSTYAESAISFSAYACITYIRVIEYASLAKVFGKTKIIMRSAVVSTLTMIVLAFPMTYLFGMWGIATCLLLSVLSQAAFYIFSYVKNLKMSLNQIFPWKELLRQFLISVASAAIIRFTLYPLLTPPGTLSMVMAGFYLLVFFICDILVYLGLLILMKNSIFLEYKNKILRTMSTSK